ncbi:uncharacterized protein LOC124458434 isoform X3 [Xenia sp. Carnegie-2017]|uniref:uncharacterized protein LOC124458434 isoform X3 n=1 Tax=Xenia sp. Carnegie-2017 TaxID=2897299 RepID=UPI001F04D27C|nr:uncharacterized protein LOC124458434 isoform X3 [Xenia sp. Carnegie-2017]
MWEDERQRRRDIGLPSQVALTVSQDRVETPVLNLEKEFNEKIKEIIDERNKVIQSELETIEKSLSPKDFKEFSQSILSQGKQPQCEATINQDVDVDSPVVDQSVIDVLQASQASNSSGELDIELVEILMSLDKDDNETLLHECSLIAGSQKGSDDEHDEDIDEDKESILMSQPFWKDNEEQHDSQSSEDEEEMDWKPPLRMPQVDGPGDDEDSAGHGSTCTTVSRGFKDKIGK